MFAARWLGVGILACVLCACGEDTPKKKHKEKEPDDGLPKACEIVSAEFVSDLLGTTLLPAPIDSGSETTCFYEKKGFPTHGGLRIEYMGAANFEQAREAIAGMYGQEPTDVDGVGDEAFSLSVTEELEQGSGTLVILVATQGEALAGVTLTDVGLTEEAGMDMAKQIMDRVLAALD